MAAWLDGENVTVPACTLVSSRCLPSAAEITGMMRVRRTKWSKRSTRNIWAFFQVVVFGSPAFSGQRFIWQSLRCCPFHNARDGDTAIYYQSLPCLWWSLSSRFVGEILMDYNRRKKATHLCTELPLLYWIAVITRNTEVESCRGEKYTKKTWLDYSLWGLCASV